MTKKELILHSPQNPSADLVGNFVSKLFSLCAKKIDKTLCFGS